MNTITKFLFKPATGFAALMLLLSACSQEVETTGKAVHEQLEASGFNAPFTRIDSWAPVQEAGLYMFDAGTATITETIDNYRYQVTAVGANGFATFRPADPNIVAYYPNHGELVDLVMYYPYSSAVANKRLTTDLADQSVYQNYYNADVLYGKVLNKSKASGPVEIPLEHTISKLRMTMVAGTGITDLTGLTVTIKGMCNAASLDLTTGAAWTATTYGDIKTFVADNPGNVIREAILFPLGKVAGAEVEFKLGNDTYSWDISDIDFTSGNLYDYAITIDRTELSASINPSTTWSGGETVTVSGQ